MSQTQTAEAAISSTTPSKREIVVLAALCGVVLVVNLLTAPLYPLVWDEVGHVDVAVHLLKGKGLTSASIYNMTLGTFFFNCYRPCDRLTIRLRKRAFSLADSQAEVHADSAMVAKTGGQRYRRPVDRQTVQQLAGVQTVVADGSSSSDGLGRRSVPILRHSMSLCLGNT